MKVIHLIRHGDSQWTKGSADFDRPLTHHGVKEAELIGNELKVKQILPDLMISSPADRAISTARLIACEVGYSMEDIRQVENIYYKGIDEMIQLVSEIEEQFKNVILVGHNPTITLFQNYLTGELIGNMPTCSVVRIELEIDSWKEIFQEL